MNISLECLEIYLWPSVVSILICRHSYVPDHVFLNHSFDSGNIEIIFVLFLKWRIYIIPCALAVLYKLAEPNSGKKAEEGLFDSSTRYVTIDKPFSFPNFSFSIRKK